MGLLSRLRGGPWLIVARWLLRHARRRWSQLPAADRRKLASLVRKSRGRWSSLSGREQSEVQRIVRRFFGID